MTPKQKKTRAGRPGRVARNAPEAHYGFPLDGGTITLPDASLPPNPLGDVAYKAAVAEACRVESLWKSMEAELSKAAHIPVRLSVRQRKRIKAAIDELARAVSKRDQGERRRDVTGVTKSGGDNELSKLASHLSAATSAWIALQRDPAAAQLLSDFSGRVASVSGSRHDFERAMRAVQASVRYLRCVTDRKFAEIQIAKSERDEIAEIESCLVDEEVGADKKLGFIPAVDLATIKASRKKQRQILASFRDMAALDAPSLDDSRWKFARFLAGVARLYHVDVGPFKTLDWSMPKPFHRFVVAAANAANGILPDHLQITDLIASRRLRRR